MVEPTYSFALSFQERAPEFLRMLEEPQIVLELPGSIVVSSALLIHPQWATLLRNLLFFLCQSKKGKCPSTQREVSVVMPNGQRILLKCEVKSRGRDLFDMIVAHSNLVEHFYFGLAYIDGEEV